MQFLQACWRLEACGSSRLQMSVPAEFHRTAIGELLSLRVDLTNQSADHSVNGIFPYLLPPLFTRYTTFRNSVIDH